jgi:two-component system chemotaxis response regulator CheB
MSRIRVLVVEDSETVRMHLTEVLASDPDIEIVGEAGDGRAAIDGCLKLRPDVITMDMMLPVMSGLAATEYIMAHRPTPILIVSASTNRGELFRTYEALAAGAVDVIEKPRGDEADGAWEAAFLARLKLVSRIRVITHLRARLRPPTGEAATSGPRESPATPSRTGSKRVFAAFAVGTSTGGPGALVELFRALPAEFPLPIFVVLHLGGPFGSAFPEWLEVRTGRHVAFAVDGELASATRGRVTMAPPDRHLLVRDGVLRLSQEEERFSCRPSVDVLFESLARSLGAPPIACLLTGMGRDGAAGLLEIRQCGGATIAQDEASCVVYGMPREAIILGAAERVLPMGEIGPAVAELVGIDMGGGAR